MRKTLLFTVWVFLGLLVIPSASASYGAPVQSTTEWQVQSDDAQIFLYLIPNDNITGKVNSHDAMGISVSLSSSARFYRLETEIIWDDLHCFPFYIDLTQLSTNVSDQEIEVVDQHTETIFGDQRDMTTIRIYKVIHDRLIAPALFTYDTETGILIRWIVTHPETEKQTIVVIKSTNAWLPLTSLPPWVIGVIIGGVSVAISILGVWIWKKRKQVPELHENTTMVSTGKKEAVVVKSLDDSRMCHVTFNRR